MFLSTTLTPLWARAWGGSYVNDPIDRGREESLRHVGEYRMLPDDISDWYVRAADDQ